MMETVAYHTIQLLDHFGQGIDYNPDVSESIIEEAIIYAGVITLTKNPALYKKYIEMFCNESNIKEIEDIALLMNNHNNKSYLEKLLQQ